MQALPTKSYSEDFCFVRGEAEELLTEIKYNKGQTSKLTTCFKQYSTAKTVIKNNKIVITGLEKDKVVLKGMSDEYKTKLVETTKDLDDCRVDKPSRVTWFGVGFGAAVVSGLIALLAIK